MAKFLSFFLLVFFVGACSGKIDGHIYLDVNANNTREDDEAFIAHLSFTVTRDDEEVETGQTDEDGYFSVNSSDAGTYCVQVTESDLTSVNDDGTSPSLVASRVWLPPKVNHIVLDSTPLPLTLTRATETDCSDGSDDDADGDVDCDDTDCSSDSSCTENDCSDETDNDSDGSIDCDDSDCSGDSDCSTSDDEDTSSATVQSGEACNESGGFHLELDVPVAVDYASGIDDLDDPATKTVSRGDSVTLDILYPSSCTFDLITLSSRITPSDVPDDAYDEATGQFNFNTAIAASSVSLSDALVVSYDPIATYELDLSINADGSLESSEISITPTVTCPDDSTVTLKTHVIDINSDDDIDITQSMSGTVALGNTITVTTVVVNNTSVDFDEVTLSLSTPTYTQNQSYDSSCSHLGQTADCVFDLSAESTMTLVTSFSMPASLQDDTTFEMTASLEVTSNGSTLTFEGDAVSFSLEGEGTD